MVGRGQGKNMRRNVGGGRGVSVQKERHFSGEQMNNIASFGIDIDVGSNTHTPLEEEVRNDNLVPSPPRDQQGKCLKQVLNCSFKFLIIMMIIHECLFLAF